MKNIRGLLILTLSLSFIWLLGCDNSSSSVAIPTTIPLLTAPHDGDTTVGLNPTFRWDNAGNKIEISWNINFSSVFHSATVGGQQSYYMSTPLQTGTWYYWHVGHSEGQNITWSTTWKFRTVQ